MILFLGFFIATAICVYFVCRITKRYFHGIFEISIILNTLIINLSISIYLVHDTLTSLDPELFDSVSEHLTLKYLIQVGMLLIPMALLGYLIPTVIKRCLESKKMAFESKLAKNDYKEKTACMFILAFELIVVLCILITIHAAWVVHILRNLAWDIIMSVD